ncbi:zinc ABC transporter substrate-binding protein [Lactiplantibacillus sp. WILCCON 0030]|uniref:Zinc ABC transporter substrate-binding protein n=1 Tax=Lactiplantibacillus brownii TaxID=3069269 RepID=A0ABU1ABY9_9LACO|nr:zinc ABC transporter substrate-binding protein [Lactiplantibacillus brownii]MDQ7938498.1 zinc ABC transporter substrate-binding protein [Lactiplantibacillus brownii]
MKKILLSLIVLLGLSSLLAGCQTATKATPTSTGKIRIIASLDFYGQAAQKVAGKYGEVTSVINRPGIDPHDFEATVKTAKVASRASLIIYNGLGYDDWMSKLIVNKADNAKVIQVGTTIAGQKDGANEHVWYDPTTMPKLAHQIALELAKIQPEHKQYFLKQAHQYQASLQPLTTEITKLKQQAHGQKVAVSEPVFDYSLAAIGYKVSNSHFAMAIEEGSDPSPKDIKQMQTAIKKHQIAFFVENIQSASNIVDNMVKLSHQNNVPVLKVTETLPAGQTYESWMLSQYQQLAKIQAQSH